MPSQTQVIQSDSNKLWIIAPYNELKENIEKLIVLLNVSRQIKSVPLYVDYSLGGSITYELNICASLSIFEDADVAARFAQINNLLYVIGDQNKQKKRSEYDLLANFVNALDSNQTYLVYQPKVDLKTLKTIGVESLIRWNHPTRGFIPPDVFIPSVEETKLIHLLTDWVLKQSLEKCKELMNLGYTLPVSINISARNLHDPDFYKRSIEIIRISQVPFYLIEFEITERILMINPIESKKILDKFVNHGIKISIDDFGSGYSSLAYLTQFPIHYIKIDRLFMKNIVSDSSMASIVKSTIDLSKTLGYTVIAEGVETKEAVDLLLNMNCDLVQGYYFAKPMTSTDLNQWLIKDPLTNKPK